MSGYENQLHQCPEAHAFSRSAYSSSLHGSVHQQQQQQPPPPPPPPPPSSAAAAAAAAAGFYGGASVDFVGHCGWSGGAGAGGGIGAGGIGGGRFATMGSGSSGSYAGFHHHHQQHQQQQHQHQQQQHHNQQQPQHAATYAAHQACRQLQQVHSAGGYPHLGGPSVYDAMSLSAASSSYGGPSGSGSASGIGKSGSGSHGGGGGSSSGSGSGSSANKKVPHVKKPLNAFMLFMKEMRAKVVAECTLKESAAINQILGRKWHALSRDEQAKYYELARKEKELHMQLHPNWSARDNYAIQVAAKKKVTKKRRPTSGELLLQQRQHHHQQQQQQQHLQQLQDAETVRKAVLGVDAGVEATATAAAAAAFADMSGYASYLMAGHVKTEYRLSAGEDFGNYANLQQPSTFNPESHSLPLPPPPPLQHLTQQQQQQQQLEQQQEDPEPLDNDGAATFTQLT